MVNLKYIFRYNPIVFLGLFLVTIHSYGQNDQAVTTEDTIFLKRGQTLVTPIRTYVARNDTSIILPSGMRRQILLSRSEVFFQNLAKSADKKLWTRELHNIILINHQKNKSADSLRTGSSVLPYVLYAGKYIRNIYIKRLDVFGPSVDDTTQTADTWVERTGNKLHFKSKEYLIRNNLLFREKDKIEPTELADNERILRNLPYIEDARINLQPAGMTGDSADVYVVVKDVWSTAFNIEVESVFSGRFQLWDRNIMGFGHEFQNNVLWNTHENPSTGYEGSYIVNNISHSFISGKINYYNSFQTLNYGLDLERSFFTPNIKYAGGLSLLSSRSRVLFNQDSVFYTPIRYNNYDVWLGRSFLLNRTGFSKMRQNITLAGRMTNDYYFQRPKITGSSYYDYQDKTLFLGSISYSRHSYFKSNLIYNFGRTEDIPIGNEIEFTLGMEHNEFFNRKYAATKLSSGLFLGNWGYLYSSIQAGSFFLSDGKTEQAVIDANLNYFSPLFVLRKFRVRQFVNVNYTAGFNRFDKEYLTFNRTYSPVGFVNDSLTGNRRFVFHWETDCFTPWELLEFHFVTFLFADHAWLTNSTNVFFNYPYTDFGIGIRIRNEHLVFNTIQLKFSFYPKIPKGSKINSFEISGAPLFNPPNFLPQAPALIPYK